MQMRQVDLGGSVAYRDFGGEGPPIVLVHGLGGNHANWSAAAPLLTAHGRVLAPDLPGFGRTAPAGRSSALPANREILHRFIEECAGGRATLVGNSMGGLLSMMLASSTPGSVSELVLVSPALPRPPRTIGDPYVLAAFAAYSVPFAGEMLVTRRARKLGPEGLVRETLRMCTVDPSRVPGSVVDELTEIARWRATMPWPSAAYLQAARSLVTIVTRRARFREMISSIDAPALVVHGRRDRLVPLAAARELVRAKPDWTLEVFDDSGHVAMLEHPERFAEVAGEWLASRRREGAA